MILEGEVGVDKLREHLGACETRENKLKKNLVKATKKDNANEVRQIEEKIVDNRSSIKATQLESKFDLVQFSIYISKDGFVIWQSIRLKFNIFGCTVTVTVNIKD